jgi:CRP/FNR family cyclic AMP-dependent transcriptional regulator
MAEVDVLQRFPLFRAFTDEERRAVAATARETEFLDGEVVFGEGRVARGCWLVETGQVALTTAVPGRPPVVIQTLGPGDVLGWSWLTDQRQWLFTATARGVVRAIALDTDRLRELADRDPRLGYLVTRALLDAALARLQSTRARLLDVYRSPRER